MFKSSGVGGWEGEGEGEGNGAWGGTRLKKLKTRTTLSSRSFLDEQPHGLGLVFSETSPLQSSRLLAVQPAQRSVSTSSGRSGHYSYVDGGSWKQTT